MNYKELRVEYIMRKDILKIFAISLSMITSCVAMADAPRYSPYNSSMASNYAYQWALSKNPQYPDFSANTLQGGDCTNFVSQALHTGGWQYTASRDDKSTNTWYVAWNNAKRAFTNSQTWSTAAGFYRRIINDKYEKSVLPTSDLYSLRPGDIAFLTSGGKSHHTMIVTGYQEKPWWNPFASYGPLVSYHNGGVNPNTNMPNLPQQNILLTEVIARSPNDTPVFAKVRS